MIKCVNAVLVICDDCGDTIMLKRWQDAPKVGWAAPIDGAFQLCPKCSKKKTDKLFAEAKLAKLAGTCPLINQ